MEHIDKSRFAHVGESAHDREAINRPSLTFTQDAMRRLVKNKMAMTCLVLLIIITLIAIFVPMIYPYNYTQQDVTGKYLQPFEYSKK